MATVPGGLFDTGNVTANEGAFISSFLDSLGLSESSLTTQTVSGGATVFTDTSTGSSSQQVIVVPGSGASTVTVGGTNTTVSTTGEGTLGIQGSATPTTAGGINTLANDIASNRIPDTATGNSVKGAITDAINNASSTITGTGNLVVVDTLGSNQNTTVTLSGTQGSSDILVISGGNTGTTLEVSNYGSIVTTGNTNVVISGSSGSWVQSIAGNASIVGGSGSDTILGAYGNYSVAGGAGNDYFGIRGGTGSSNIISGQSGQALTNDSGESSSAQAASGGLKTTLVIDGFDVSEDAFMFDIEGVTTFAEFKTWLATAKQVGDDLVATSRNGDTITLTGIQLTSLSEDMFNFS